MKLLLKGILGLCVLAGNSIAWGMQEQQIPQDLQNMLQQHKDLTLKNKKITNVIKFLGLESLILAGGYTLFSLIPRLDSKLLGGKFLRAIRANGALSHDIKGFGIMMGGACCFAVAGTAIGVGFFKCLDYLISKLPGERRQRALETTIAQRADRLTYDQLGPIFHHFRGGAVVQDFGTNLGCRLWRLYRSKKSEEARDRIRDIVQYYGYQFP